LGRALYRVGPRSSVPPCESLRNQIGLLAALRPHERVLVLLQLLGGQQRVDLARNAIEAV